MFETVRPSPNNRQVSDVVCTGSDGDTADPKSIQLLPNAFTAQLLKLLAMFSCSLVNISGSELRTK